MIKYLIYRAFIIYFGFAQLIHIFPRCFRGLEENNKYYEVVHFSEEPWDPFINLYGRYDKHGYLGHIFLIIHHHEFKLR